MTDTEATDDVVISRHFDAPREAVYRAFVDPDDLAQWFGPVGFLVPRDTVYIDARPGGHQRFVMVSDDGTMRSPIEATFTEVVENELLMGTEAVEGIPGFEGLVQLHLRLEFHDDEGGARVELRQGPFGDQLRADSIAGWNSSFTKLDALLAR
jgi:uncharacterized protein YndB with AHSA1/START domain